MQRSFILLQLLQHRSTLLSSWSQQRFTGGNPIRLPINIYLDGKEKRRDRDTPCEPPIKNSTGLECLHRLINIPAFIVSASRCGTLRDFLVNRRASWENRDRMSEPKVLMLALIYVILRIMVACLCCFCRYVMDSYVVCAIWMTWRVERYSLAVVCFSRVLAGILLSTIVFLFFLSSRFLLSYEGCNLHIHAYKYK